MGYADLHIHTTVSDSSLSPEEAVARAAQNGVSLMAVCDHNLFEGALAAEPLAARAGIRFIRGVEVDALFEGRDIHLLAYGADFSNAPFREMVAHARWSLDHMSEVLLERLKPEYPQLDMREYHNFSHNPELGGWKMLQYLLKKGVISTVREGMALYPKLDVTYAGAGFTPIDEVVRLIHEAGGTIVLAHPGEVFGHTADDGFMALVSRVIDLGVDGIECFYPTHSPEMTERLLAFAREKGLKITSGCDCHGAFGKTDIGQLKTDESLIVL